MPVNNSSTEWSIPADIDPSSLMWSCSDGNQVPMQFYSTHEVTEEDEEEDQYQDEEFDTECDQTSLSVSKPNTAVERDSFNAVFLMIAPSTRSLNDSTGKDVPISDFLPDTPS